MISNSIHTGYNASDFSDIDFQPAPLASSAANRQDHIHHNVIHQDVTHNHSVNRGVNSVTQQPKLECQEPFCKRNGAFASKTGIERHEEKEHSEKCIDCGAGFATIKYLGEHVNKVHRHTKYPCKHFVIDENYICTDEKCRKSIHTKEEVHYMETPSGRRPVYVPYRKDE